MLLWHHWSCNFSHYIYRVWNRLAKANLICFYNLHDFWCPLDFSLSFTTRVAFYFNSNQAGMHYHHSSCFCLGINPHFNFCLSIICYCTSRTFFPDVYIPPLQSLHHLMSFLWMTLASWKRNNFFFLIFFIRMIRQPKGLAALHRCSLNNWFRWFL